MVRVSISYRFEPSRCRWIRTILAVAQPAKPIRVGVWPGRSRGGNPFVDVFSEGLRKAGASVYDIQVPAATIAGQIDVFHIHWPEQLFWAGGGTLRIARRLMRTLRWLRQIKVAGVPIVWMVHNLEPHDMSWQQRVLWSFYSRRICSIVDGFLTLSPATIEPVRRGLPGLRDKPGHSVWIPATPQVDPDPSRSQVRAELGLSEKTHLFAFLGLLRPYKGIETLIEAFRRIPEGDNELLIAGAPNDEAYAAMLSDMAAAHPRIHLVFRHLSDAEYDGYQAASDVVVLPYHRYLHSSAMVHAVSSHTPVVTPDTPFARALSQEVGQGWMEIYGEKLDPEALLACRKPRASPKLDALSTKSMGDDVMGFYRGLLRA